MPLISSRRNWCVAALLGLGLFRTAAGAGPAAVRWDELDGLLSGRRVTIPFAGQGAVMGQVLAVREDGLLPNVTQTSVPGLYPRGQTSVARSAITEVRLLEERTAGGRTMGAVVGALVGLVAGMEIAEHATRADTAGVLTLSATAVACTVGGYLIGRSADRHTTVLRIADSREPVH